MSNTKCILFYFFLCISFLSCAQSKNLVKKIYATYSVHLPGNIAVDKNGNPISAADTINIIYIETSEEINWQHALKNERKYSIITTLITDSVFDAGSDKNTSQKIILRTTKGNKLWKLRLIPEEKKMDMPVISSGEIIIEGVYNGKKIKQKINSQTEITSIPSA